MWAKEIQSIASDITSFLLLLLLASEKAVGGLESIYVVVLQFDSFYQEQRSSKQAGRQKGRVVNGKWLGNKSEIEDYSVFCHPLWQLNVCKLARRFNQGQKKTRLRGFEYFEFKCLGGSCSFCVIRPVTKSSLFASPSRDSFRACYFWAFVH